MRDVIGFRGEKIVELRLTRRVFVRSVHLGTQAKGISKIPLAHELTSENLKRLYNEVSEFWQAIEHKPITSVFS
jgi:hypothetical protein